MPTSETAATFAVDLGSMAAVPGESTGMTVARLILPHLTVAGIECSEPSPIESGARFTAQITERKLPILVGPAPARAGTEPGRWFFAIGTSVMPSARLIGAKDDGARARLATAVADALRASPGIEEVAWTDIEASSGRRRRRRSREK